MEFKNLGDVKEFKKIMSLNIYGWDSQYYENEYKVFYGYKTSFIYNLNTDEVVKLPFTNFDPSIISDELNSIFLFKKNKNLSKEQKYTLYRYDVNTSEKKNEYPLYQHLYGKVDFLIRKLVIINDSEIAILVKDFEKMKFKVIILNYCSSKSYCIELDDSIYIDDYQKNPMFVYNQKLYIPYIIQKEKNMAMKWLFNYKILKKEEGILELENKRFNIVRKLDINKNYNFFTDKTGKYLAIVIDEGKGYQILIQKNNKMLLDKRFAVKYIKKNKCFQVIDFGFTIDNNENTLFYMHCEDEYKLFNITEKTMFTISSLYRNSGGEMLVATLLPYNKILFNSNTTSNNTVRDVCEYNIPQN